MEKDLLRLSKLCLAKLIVFDKRRPMEVTEVSKISLIISFVMYIDFRPLNKLFTLTCHAEQVYEK